MLGDKDLQKKLLVIEHKINNLYSELLKSKYNNDPLIKGEIMKLNEFVNSYKSKE